MATFSQFTPYVMPELPGAPLPMVEDALVDGARELADRTWAFRAVVPVTFVPGTGSYALVPSAVDEVIAATGVSVGGAYPITPSAPSTNTRLNPAAGTPFEYWVSGQSLMVAPVPEVAVAVEVEVATRPIQGATAIPDVFLPYRTAIAMWAKYKLMSMVGQTWSNPEGAAISMAEFIRQVRLCTYERNTGKSAAPLRVQTNFF
jgi:hypothetical protein